MSVGGRVCLSVCRGCVCLSVGVCVCVYVVGERQLLEPTVGKANQSHPGVISPLESTPVFSTISSSVFACLVKIE